MERLTWTKAKWWLAHSAGTLALTVHALLVQLAIGYILTDTRIIITTAISSTGFWIVMEFTGIAGFIWGGGEQTKDSIADGWDYQYPYIPMLILLGMWQWGLAVFGVWLIVGLSLFYAGWRRP